MCIIQDDRTPEQITTHIWAVVARDAFLSNWGLAKGGTSRCAWAAENLETVNKLFTWVNKRSEMKNVSIVKLNEYKVPKGTKHFHIYVPGEHHPAWN